MIVRDLGIVDIPLLPAEAHAPLVIDADIVLPRPVAGTFFESIPRRYRKTLERPPSLQVPMGRARVRDLLPSLLLQSDRKRAASLGTSAPKVKSVQGDEHRAHLIVYYFVWCSKRRRRVLVGP